MAYCTFISGGSDRYRCAECGFEVTTKNTPIYRKCKGLGDRVESALSSIGITQERYKAAKRAIGLSDDCNCNERKEWLNKLL
jgi:hypothetical protein